jgi:TrmH family RNA methyltransferase
VALKETVITSRQNPVVRKAAGLLDSSDKRRQEKMFLCEGARLCQDAALSGIKVEACFYTKSAKEKYSSYLEAVWKVAGAAYCVEEHVAKLLSSTKNSQGVFCLCNMPERKAGKKVSGVVLENLQDPGNLGTVLRTAEALGIEKVILLGSCCDPFSPKVLRASMGAVFRLSLEMEEDVEKLGNRLKGEGITLLAAVPDASAVPVTEIDFQKGLYSIWIGNEGNGLTRQAMDVCHKKVVIPMIGRAESFNASAAATILLWEMQRGCAK